MFPNAANHSAVGTRGTDTLTLCPLLPLPCARLQRESSSFQSAPGSQHQPQWQTPCASQRRDYLVQSQWVEGVEELDIKKKKQQKICSYIRLQKSKVFLLLCVLYYKLQLCCKYKPFPKQWPFRLFHPFCFLLPKEQHSPGLDFSTHCEH